MVKNDHKHVGFSLFFLFLFLFFSKLCCTSSPSNCTSSGCARNHLLSLIHIWPLLGRTSNIPSYFVHLITRESAAKLSEQLLGGLSSETRTSTAAAVREPNIVWQCGAEVTTSSSHLRKYYSSGRASRNPTLQKKLHKGSSGCSLFQALITWIRWFVKKSPIILNMSNFWTYEFSLYFRYYWKFSISLLTF